MPINTGRREFLKTGAALTIAGLAGPHNTAAGSEEQRKTDHRVRTTDKAYKVQYYEFTEHPESDSTWSLSVGPDGRIYAAACAERTPGNTVKIVRYNEEQDKLDYLFDLDKMVDDPADSGRATQCKIHYSFVPSMSDGIMYMASHLSGPPIDQPAYSPWRSWHDKERCFRGAALLAFDTKTDKVLWWDTLIPREGCRCLLHDEERGLLYALSYPRDHFIIYDLEKRTRQDVGRIGSVNAQVLFMDEKHRVYTSSDDGRLVRYDPSTGRLTYSPYLLPHDPAFQTGWHSVFYDAVASPDGQYVYACTWIAKPYLMRFRLNELSRGWPIIDDLGPATQERDQTMPVDTFKDHCGGLTFAGDGQLYFVASRWRDPIYNPMPDAKYSRQGVLWRLNPHTNKKQEVALLECEAKVKAQYVSRGAVDHNGNLFFGHIGSTPSGLFKVDMPASRRKTNAHLPIRMWG